MHGLEHIPSHLAEKAALEAFSATLERNLQARRTLRPQRSQAALRGVETRRAR